MSSVPIPIALQQAAERSDETRGYTFLADDGSVRERISFRDLAGRASRLGAALLRRGLEPGDRVGLILPENTEFVVAFFACMHAGIVPVPIAPPLNVGKMNTFVEHVRHIVVKSGAALLLTSERIRSVIGCLIGGTLRWVSELKDLEVDERGIPVSNRAGSDIAFLQFTSGSTSHPKGVALSHRNLSANASCITQAGLGLTPEDIGCSWLPLFHDMGLIGFVISPLVTATPIVLLSPLAFVRRPSLWLKMMSDHQGTISFGPNFAYGLCVKRVKDSELEGVRLDRWRVAGCGAEPIQIGTLRTFARRFENTGFRESAFLPSYGLAESTLAVTFSSPGIGIRGDRIDLARLAESGRAEPVDESVSGSSLVVSCGKAFPEHEVRIVDSAGGTLPERRVGEIVISGPSVMLSYYEDEAATRAACDSGQLRTGDLGYLSDGELFVCGRLKEVIILSGRNYYPTDVELCLADVEQLRKGNVVAFGLSDPVRGEEALVICAETKGTIADPAALRKEIEGRVVDSIGLRPDDVVLLPPDALPKTSSGKLQRGKAKELYVSGKLGSTSGSVVAKLTLLKHWAISQWKLGRQ